MKNTTLLGILLLKNSINISSGYTYFSVKKCPLPIACYAGKMIQVSHMHYKCKIMISEDFC
jgi:hypothetical protein